MNDDALFSGQPGESVVWMSHTDRIAKLPEGFQITASTDHCPIAAMSCSGRRLYTVQFHPEVNHSAHGRDMLYHFLYTVSWIPFNLRRCLYDLTPKPCGTIEFESKSI